MLADMQNHISLKSSLDVMCFLCGYYKISYDMPKMTNAEAEAD